ncbi:hypothetical protein COU61_01090 [Candidatus Pacearchaeota archaeon CG10_big_fil_rev_8_21_14_0_10_35_13]|nr:MAG: hypothetical protein COU61_01090 [Candidatus Pacearchaeota archaeon CG10_big_fil_rev_8_21_14_0_10_35_13]
MSKRYDAIIALSRNWKAESHRALREGRKESLGIDDLHPESKMVAIAGAYALMDGKADKLIICGGRTAGMKHPSESYMMLQYLEGLFPEVAEELERNTHLDLNSRDTRENALEAKRIIEEEKMERVALTAVGTQLPRALRIFRNNGIIVSEGYTAEGLLRKYGEQTGEEGKWMRILRNYWSSPELRTRIPQEVITATLVFSGIDPKGELTGRITSMMPTRRGHI